MSENGLDNPSVGLLNNIATAARVGKAGLVKARSMGEHDVTGG